MFRFSIPFIISCSLAIGLMATTARAQDGLRWFVEQSVSAEAGSSGVTLYFGIPQTDAVLFWAECSVAQGRDPVQMTIGADVDGLATDQSVQVSFAAPQLQWATPAHVVRYEEFIYGVQANLSLDAPIWAALITQSAVQYGVPGQQGSVLPLRGSAGPVRQFVETCRATVENAGPVASQPAPPAGQSGGVKK